MALLGLNVRLSGDLLIMTDNDAPKGHNVPYDSAAYIEGMSAYIALITDGLEAKCRYRRDTNSHACWHEGFVYIREHPEEFRDLIDDLPTA